MLKYTCYDTSEKFFVDRSDVIGLYSHRFNNEEALLSYRDKYGHKIERPVYHPLNGMNIIEVVGETN